MCCWHEMPSLDVLFVLPTNLTSRINCMYVYICILELFATLYCNVEVVGLVFDCRCHILGYTYEYDGLFCYVYSIGLIVN